MICRLLLLDDEPFVLNALKRCLNEGVLVGGELCSPIVDAFSTAAPALGALREFGYDLVLSDYRMPDMNGVEFLSAVQALQPTAVRIILSGQTDFAGLVSAINDARITRFIAKPWDDDALRLAIGEALATGAAQREMQRLADLKLVEQARLTPHEAEMRRLAEERPALFHVNWGPDGSILLDDDE